MTKAHIGAAAAPIIETERLIMRGHRLSDFDDCVRHWSDAVVTRFIGGRPFSDEEVWARVLRYAGHWSLMGYGFWLVADRETGRFIGEVGFADYRRDITPAYEGMPEIGWSLMPWAHGKRYAAEAVEAALGWGDRHFAAKPTKCLVHPDHQVSLGLARKFGYREACRTTYKDHPVVILVRNS